MANKPLPYRPAAVPTHLGWAHEKTGEQLTSHRNLEPAEGTEDYQPNNRKWMTAYNEGPEVRAKISEKKKGENPRTDVRLSVAARRGGADIEGATAATHVIVAEDQGTNIAVKVTATNTAGSATATSADTAVPEA